jgi:Asp-tRNA(Asn)/Glu-tRNA(Gln) amidotransferase A subunit family amidase
MQSFGMSTNESINEARRRFLAITSAAGLGGTLFPGALLGIAAATVAWDAEAQSASDAAWPAITTAMLDAAAAIAAITLTNAQKQMMLDGVTAHRNGALRVRALDLPNSLAPTTVFDPLPMGVAAPMLEAKRPVKMRASRDAVKLEADLKAMSEDGALAEEALAFATVRELGELLRARRITSVALTKLYLARLKKYDQTLHFVITLTEERALKQAAAMDKELRAGHDRGPLHGIPWGAKDLFAVKGYPTTWGAAGFEQQSFDEDAEVVKRLDAAGAVLVAKLSMGALAQGDLWGYPAGSGKPGGRTRNPWNVRQGSSGSSAGSASAVSAGCVAFALGTETLGSISSPCMRCGVTGLRPSFGMVPRTGAMALSWSMDKIGPIARSVEDTALVLHVIYGPDERDQSVRNAAFYADLTIDVAKLRVGFLKSAFDAPQFTALTASETEGLSAADKAKRIADHRADYERDAYDTTLAAKALDRLRAMGVRLEPVELPKFPFSALLNILSAEGAASFDTLTRSGRDTLLPGQKSYDWPNSFRTARFIPAVDYIQAERARGMAIEAMHAMFSGFDVIVAPSGGAQLTAANLCGQPAVIVPNGLRGADAPDFAKADADDWPSYGGPGTPVSITFLAGLYEDAKAVALADAYQRAAGFSGMRPPLD